jgi:TetR/AcrR family transcriptional repressor of mexJK operon
MPRGRPKDPAKRDALLDAVRTLFCNSPQVEVTIDEIIRVAGVSRATFYAHFKDIDAALEAVILRESERIATDELVSETQDDVEKTLFEIGMRLYRLLNSPEMAGFDHIMAEVARKQPALAKRFFDVGPGRSHKVLTRLIKKYVEAGKLRRDAPTEMAADLTGLWQGAHGVKARYGQRTKLAETDYQSRVRRGIRLFMALYGR